LGFSTLGLRVEGVSCAAPGETCGFANAVSLAPPNAAPRPNAASNARSKSPAPSAPLVRAGAVVTTFEL